MERDGGRGPRPTRATAAAPGVRRYRRPRPRPRRGATDSRDSLGDSRRVDAADLLVAMSRRPQSDELGGDVEMTWTDEVT